jgi:hypothetical protein
MQEFIWSFLLLEFEAFFHLVVESVIGCCRPVTAVL